MIKKNSYSYNLFRIDFFIFLLLFSILIQTSILSISTEFEESIKLRYQGKFDEAIQKLKSSKFLGDPESELLLAKLYLDTGMYVESINLYTRHCKTINTFECYNEMGIAFMELQNYPQAIENFEKSILLNPLFANGYSNLGACYTKSGEFKKAESKHSKALDMMPNNPFIRINYGVYLIKTKKYQKAKDILYPVLTENEAMYYAELYVGVAHYFKEEYNLALIHYNRGIKINPEFSDLYYYRSLLYYKKGEYENALIDLKMVESLTPNSSKAGELKKLIQLSRRL